ncbi:unnamed protein product [Vicia faba]|uniref:RING-CH-type domain-containing protein n=1 Tax=Vicia faba TaxID=3906 RepID=A0AAV1AXP6_VICFA|nr:unnamed protein product [Vicia faba]
MSITVATCGIRGSCDEQNAPETEGLRGRRRVKGGDRQGAMAIGGVREMAGAEDGRRSAGLRARREIGEELHENLDGGIICKICHLASGQPLEETSIGTPYKADDKTGLIMPGCACKDELGIAHSHCAKSWFKIKENK